MKKSLLKVAAFAVMVFIGAAFTSCGDDENPVVEGNETTATLTEKYFTVEEGVFIPENLPAGTIPLISNVSVNNSVINGGSTRLSFVSVENLTTVYIGVQGVQGYIKVDITPVAQSLAGYEYELILLLSQVLNGTDFTVCVSGVSSSGAVSTPILTDPVEIVEVGTGKLQVSLSWDQMDDVDLHLFEPDGTEIYYGNPLSSDAPSYDKLMFDFYCYIIKKYTSHNTANLNYLNYNDWDLIDLYLEDVPYTADIDAEYAAFVNSSNNSYKIYGELDLDSNAGCGIDGVNNENITYQNNVKAGTYKVYVDLYDKCNYSTAGAKYSVTVRFNGQPVTVSNHQSGQFPNDYTGSYDYFEQYVYIGEFTVPGNAVRSAAVAGNPKAKEIAKKLFKK